jgi:DNA polymerase III epsilon subunit family exonuclease
MATAVTPADAGCLISHPIELGQAGRGRAVLDRSKWGWIPAGLLLALGVAVVLAAQSFGWRNLGAGQSLLLAASLGLVVILAVAIRRAGGRRARLRRPAVRAGLVVPPHLNANGRITAQTPLAGLSALALDTETTGLDPVRDRIVQLGAVRLHGGELLRDQAIDLLINPGRRIPAVSTAVHGISDRMVQNAPPYAEVAPEIMAALKGVALIGHHTVFDLAVLRRASASIGMDWQDPPWLDTALIYSALYPEARLFDLDAVAQHVGVAIRGRHTALGDALATAEIYLKLLPDLEAHGIVTLGQAIAFQMTSRKAAHAHRVTRITGP